MTALIGGDSMLGSLTLYRRLLLENVFSNPHIRSMTPFTRGSQSDYRTLPSFGHGIAGIMAGTTVSFIAAPVEHIKARLQIQYAADKSKRMYSGPIDCLRKLVSADGSDFLEGVADKRPVEHTWYLRRLPWSICHHLIPFLLFLLVGILRCFDPVDEREHQNVSTGRQLLGRWYLRTDLLDHLVPVGRGQAASDDGSHGRIFERWTATILLVEGRSQSGLSGARMERLLERICALFPKGIPGECHGFGCIRRCDAVVALIDSYIYRTHSVIECTLSSVYRWPYIMKLSPSASTIFPLWDTASAASSTSAFSPSLYTTASSFGQQGDWCLWRELLDSCLGPITFHSLYRIQVIPFILNPSSFLFPLRYV